MRTIDVEMAASSCPPARGPSGSTVELSPSFTPCDGKVSARAHHANFLDPTGRGTLSSSQRSDPAVTDRGSDCPSKSGTSARSQGGRNLPGPWRASRLPRSPLMHVPKVDDGEGQPTLSSMDSAAHGVLDAARDIFEELDEETLLVQILESARELAGARYGAIGVLAEDGRRLARFLTSGI